MHGKPPVAKHARTEYNALLAEDEGDWFPLDMLDDVVAVIVPLYKASSPERRRASNADENPSEELKETEKTARNSVEYVHILGY